MKAEKVFVRYKNLNQQADYNKQRTEKRPQDKKKYAEKTSRPRQALKIIYESFQPSTEMPAYVQTLFSTYPKFFNKEGRQPEKANSDSLNQFLILNRHKLMDVLKDPKKEHQRQSSSDPDWNSDDEIDSDMESKKIDQTIVEKIVEKLSDRQIKKAENLKPHEKRFLQDYYREKNKQPLTVDYQNQNSKTKAQTSKRIVQQKDKNNEPKQKLKKQLNASNQDPKDSKSKENIWSQYQNRQVNTFVTLGFMTKIEDNEEEIAAEVVQDDDMFNNDSDQEGPKSKSQPSEESLEEDDIFGDQNPTTTIKTKNEPKILHVESEKKITQGTVVINDHLFSKIAEMVGLLPVRCNWIIKNQFQKFKVTTEYMDAYYRKEKMYQILPMISLNHSEFISNDKVETAEGVQILRDYNYRLRNHTQHNSSYPRSYKYKEKQLPHLKKK